MTSRVHVQWELESDLILPDQHLTKDRIDKLWDWFCNATKDQMDLQLVFVKLLNSARKPYVEHLSTQQSPSSGDQFESWTNTCYTPSERTQVDPSSEMPSATPTRSSIFEQDLQRQVADTEKALIVKSNCIRALEDQLAQDRDMNEEKCRELEAKNNELRDLLASRTSALETRTLELAEARRKSAGKPIRFALESVNYSGRYLSLNASGITAYMQPGGGTTCARPSLGAWETFEIIPSPDTEGVVHFKSTTFDNIFLRADASKVLEKSVKDHVNGGTVNAQYGCGKLEQFRIVSLSNRKVAIESVAFPGRFVRLHANEGVVNMQGTDGCNREFYIVIVT